MYKVLVVDEEPGFIEDITEVINKNIDLAKVSGSATDGKTALEKARIILPDIIILDVKIPGINGLEVIKRVRKLIPNVHVVIASAYDYFGFLREALKLRVDDYILKPLNKANLIDILNDITMNIKKEEAISKEENENKVVFDDVMEYAEQSFIYSAIFKGNWENDYKKFKNLFELKSYGFIINIEIDMKNMLNSNDKDLSSEKAFYSIKQVLYNKKYKGIVGPQISNQILVYVSVDEKMLNSNGYKEKMLDISEEIGRKLEKELEQKVHIGIGSIVPLSDIHSSYEESILCLAGRDDALTHIDDLDLARTIDYKEYKELEKSLVKGIKDGKEEVIDIFCSLLDKIKDLNVYLRKNKIIELLMLSCYSARNYGKSEVDYFDYQLVMDEIKSLSASSLNTWATNKFQIIMKTIRNHNTEKVSNVVISMAIRYIEEHYQEQFTLDEVSKHVSVSSPYLSKLFKEETDYNFIEYLTNLRMNKAKEFILSGDMAIKEIGYAVGYQDPNYFSRKFKAIYGIAPTDYGKNMNYS